MPEVSVIIPIYNTAAYLRKALDSICGQTLKELEIILIDDGSTDGSHGIIEEYAKRDARIRWYAQPQPGIIRCTQPRIAACYRQVHIFYGQ